MLLSEREICCVLLSCFLHDSGYFYHVLCLLKCFYHVFCMIVGTFIMFSVY